MSSGSTVCTDFPRDPVRTWRWFHHSRRQRHGWPLPVDTPPTRPASLCSKVSLMSCHSSPQCRLMTFVSWITPPLRFTPITGASTLLQAAPPLAPASVFFLMVSAIRHFPLHPEKGSHVPYQSLYWAHAAYTPTADGSVNRYRPDLSR